MPLNVYNVSLRAELIFTKSMRANLPLTLKKQEEGGGEQDEKKKKRKNIFLKCGHEIQGEGDEVKKKKKRKRAFFLSQRS